MCYGPSSLEFANEYLCLRFEIHQFGVFFVSLAHKYAKIIPHFVFIPRCWLFVMLYANGWFIPINLFGHPRLLSHVLSQADDGVMVNFLPGGSMQVRFIQSDIWLNLQSDSPRGNGIKIVNRMIPWNFVRRTCLGHKETIFNWTGWMASVESFQQISSLLEIHLKFVNPQTYLPG